MMILNGQRTKNTAIIESVPSRKTNQDKSEPKAARPSDLPLPILQIGEVTPKVEKPNRIHVKGAAQGAEQQQASF